MREEKLSQVRERERTVAGDHLLYLRVLLLPLVLILSLRKFRGFLLYGFPKENSLCLLSLMFIVVHVILSYKILTSYCLNDKNLTTSSKYNYNVSSPTQLIKHPLIDIVIGVILIELLKLN